MIYGTQCMDMSIRSDTAAARLLELRGGEGGEGGGKKAFVGRVTNSSE